MVKRSDPLKAIASVRTKQTGEDTPIGSAFFITRSLLITAKHVLRNPNNELYKDLSLGQIPLHDRVPFGEKDIDFHPDLDIALIRFDHEFVDEDSFLELCFNFGTKNQPVDICAFDCEAKISTIAKDINIDKYDSTFRLYTLPHSVKPGFSGGAITLKNSNVVIGLVVSRNKNGEQESFFLDFKSCREWLKNINSKIEDTYLATHLTLKQVSYIQQDQKFEAIKQLALLIGRPKSAYFHVIDEIKSNGMIKACLCLYSSNEDDKPKKFASSLKMLLHCNNISSSSQKRNLLTQEIIPSLLKYEEEYCPEFEVDPWKSLNQEEFIKSCLIEVIKHLNGNTADSKDENLAIIYKLHKAYQKSFLIIFNTKMADQRSIFDWKNNRQILEIEKRFQWICEFNKVLNDFYLKQAQTLSFKPLVILFSIQLEKSIFNKAKYHCFQLTNLTIEDFTEWKSPICNYFMSDFDTKFDTLEKHFNPTLTYKQFLEHIELALNEGQSS